MINWGLACFYQVQRNIFIHLFLQVHHLRGEAVKIQDEMQQAQDDLDLQEQEVSHLRGKLKRMGSRDSLYVGIIGGINVL